MNKQLTLKDGRNLSIVQLTTEQLPEILALQERVLGALTTGAFLQPLIEEEFLSILQGKGIMIGAYYKERLIAFRAMLEPEIDAEHLGIDAGLRENELPKVIYSEISNVDPDFRGNGLQSLLGERIFQEVDTGRFHYICATVAPFNIASLKDKFGLGMEIVALKVKYGNMLRYVFLKSIAQAEKKHFAEKRLIGMEQTEEQQRYLQEGWIGTGMEKRVDKWFVCYER
ncbi:GNAT family N-acetyltransferase [Sporosarcina soli]|uniref:GNAT family N-acetyltransferase n=1 Tax=Sporosarcina soli TaxID=334736 RepID=A0ABW0TNX4_9BACL